MPDAWKAKYHMEKANVSYFDLFDNFTVDKLRVDGEEPMEVIRLEHSVSHALAGNALYMCSYYKELLKECLDSSNVLQFAGTLPRFLYVLLLGNPGIGKSFIQYIILVALMVNKASMPAVEASETLQTICHSLKDINVVVRQVGHSPLDVFFINEREHVVCDVVPDDAHCSHFFDVFDPKHMLYLFEPGTEEVDPPITGIHPGNFRPIGQMLWTLPPDPRRYKEFAKQVSFVQTYHMPLPTKQQILAIGQDMVQHGYIPSDLLQYYTPEGLSESYDRMPTRRFAFVQDVKARQSAEKNIARDIARFITNHERLSFLDTPEFSYNPDQQTVLFDVPLNDDGTYDFKECITHVNPEVLRKLGMMQRMRLLQWIENEWSS